MKKIVTFLFISFPMWAFSQGFNIDTVKLLNVTFNAKSWAYMSGIFNGDNPEAIRFERKLRNAVQAASPITGWNQNITVDTVPGRIALWIYSKYMQTPVGIVENPDESGANGKELGTNIATVLNAITNDAFVFFRTQINLGFGSEFILHRNRGENKNIDQ